MRALTPWRAGRALSGVHNEIDEIVERFFGSDFGSPAFGGTEALRGPAIEAYRKDDKLVVRADLPGIDPKEVELAVEGDRLTVRGERRSSEETEGGAYREVRYGRFERTVQLPTGVDPDSVKATYRDGVLEITMAVPKAFVARKVPITVH